MMVSKGIWTIIAVGLGVVIAVIIGVSNSYIPGYEDIYDPLGRPVDLSGKVIESANAFDRISAELVPKHRELAQRIGVLVGVANDLDTLVNHAAELPGLARQINQMTARDIQLAQPLPNLVLDITSRVTQVNPQLNQLDNSIAEAGKGIRKIVGNLDTLKPGIARLDAQAQEIAGILAQILRDARIAGPLGPLLQTLCSLNLPLLSAC